MILITGCGSQLGSSIARKLAAQGWNLVLHTHQPIEVLCQLSQACSQLGAEVHCVSWDLHHVEQSLAQYSGPMITGLVYTVGPYLENPPSRMSETLEFLLPLEFLAPIALTEALLPGIRQAKGGVVYLGTSGLRGVWQRASAYYLLKHSLWTYTQCLAKELASACVRVNMVSPGHLNGSIVLEDPKILPMGRTVADEEVASMIAYLFSDQALSITGQNIEIAGGVGL